MLISLFKYRHGARVYQISAPLSRYHAATSTTPSVPPPIKDFSPRQKAVPPAKSKFCFRRIPRTLPIFPHCISGSLFLFPHPPIPSCSPRKLRQSRRYGRGPYLTWRDSQLFLEFPEHRLCLDQTRWLGVHSRIGAPGELGRWTVLLIAKDISIRE